MIQHLLERIKSVPEKQGPPRLVFGVLAGLMAFLLISELVRVAQGHGQPLRETIGLAGMLLLMIFFFSRQPQIRLVSYFAAVAFLTVWLVQRVARAFL